MTLVYQSYRTTNVPGWIQLCLKSVKEWTQNQGFEYRFIDDEMFGYAPDWYRKKVRDNVQLVSDLSRLNLAKKFLKEGYERVIWMDADLLIFDPEVFSISTKEGVHFCREIWTDVDLEGNIIHQKNINNSVSVFHKNNVFLDFYIDACLKLVDSKEKIPPVVVGTTFLTGLRKIYPFSVITNVGIISPALTYDLITGNDEFLKKYREWHGAPVYAANLCGSMKDHTFKDLRITEGTMTEVATKLLNRKFLS